MQEQLAAAQAELAEAEVTGTAGGGLVTVTMTGIRRVPGRQDRPEGGRPGRRRDPARTWWSPPCTTPTEAAQRADRGEDGPAPGGLGGLRRPRPAGLLSRHVRGRGPGPDRRAGPAARRRAEERAAHRLPPAAADPADVTRLAAALQGQGAGAVLRDLLQRGRVRAVPDLPRPAPHATRCICVVEEPKDVVAIERTGEFRGRYHVLGGAINPLEGIGPDNLRIRELMARLGGGRRSRS